MDVASLIACQECDLLQRETPVPRNGVARCARCGATLYRHHPDSLERTLAFTLSAIVLYVIANAFPIVGLDIQGQKTEATLYGAVRALYDQDMRLVAGLVFFTTMLAPTLEVAAMCYLLLPLKFGWVPYQFAPVFRLLKVVRPWSMVEVFMLGIIVALVKLAHIAIVIPGIAMWSFGGLMLLFAAMAASFDPRVLWAAHDYDINK